MKTTIILLVTALTLLMPSCKKKPSAGLGGNANLRISARHHGLTIDSCTISIKFNTSEAPSCCYDITQAVSTDSNGNSYALIQGLKKGNYYLLAEGWDPSITENVKGGIPYTIAEEKDINITIPVTESH